MRDTTLAPHRRTPARLIVVIAALATALLAPAPRAAAAVPPVPPAPTPQVEPTWLAPPAIPDPVTAVEAMHRHIDDARAAAGLAGLQRAPELAAVAQRWTGRMADDGRLAHNPDLREAVAAHHPRVGENVGVARYPDADVLTTVGRLHDMFMASTGHRANVLHPDFRSVGIGLVEAADGRTWVTLVFSDQPPAPAEVAPRHYRRAV